MFLFAGLLSRAMHETQFEEFAYSRTLWYVQNISQLILAILVLVFPLILDDNMALYSPILYAGIAMLILNALGNTYTHKKKIIITTTIIFFFVKKYTFMQPIKKFNFI